MENYKDTPMKPFNNYVHIILLFFMNNDYIVIIITKCEIHHC